MARLRSASASRPRTCASSASSTRTRRIEPGHRPAESALVRSRRPRRGARQAAARLDGGLRPALAVAARRQRIALSRARPRVRPAPARSHRLRPARPLHARAARLRTPFRSSERSRRMRHSDGCGGAPKRSRADEYCDRRLLARIHRYTLDRLRREIDPVSQQDFMRFLLRWQHLAPDRSSQGKQGVRQAIARLAGFEAAAGAWERELLDRPRLRLPPLLAGRALPRRRGRLGAPHAPQGRRQRRRATATRADAGLAQPCAPTSRPCSPASAALEASPEPQDRRRGRDPRRS